MIVIETHAAILSALGPEAALRFVLALQDSATSIIRAGVSDEREALEILRRYTDKGFSFADAISFAVMRRLGITTAFTFDRHFAQFGLSSLR